MYIHTSLKKIPKNDKRIQELVNLLKDKDVKYGYIIAKCKLVDCIYMNEEFINKINDLIEKNMDNDEFSIADITSSLSISRSLLHIKMKSLLNISTGDYIRKRRLNKACSLLKEGYNVSETAYHTGFADPNYFSKAFKKEFGVSPTEYLNNNHKQ